MDEGAIKVFQMIAALLLCYGVATVILVLATNPSDFVVTVILRSYSAMFAGFLGLIAGFLAGRRM